MRYGITILFLVLAVALFFKYTKPYYDETKLLKTDRDTLEEALGYSRELQTLRDDLLGQYNSISQEDIERLNKMLPSKIRSDDIMVLLEDRTKARGLLLKRIDVREAENAADPNAALGTPLPLYNNIEISLSMSGSYSSFLSLLEDLEKSLQLIDVTSITFSAARSSVYEFSVNAVMHALPTSASTVVLREREGQEAEEIVAALSKLKVIRIDAEFFKSEIFASLTEFFPVIEIPKDYGRFNPFLPYEEKI